MLPTVGWSPIGATAPASPRTRRSTADAGKIPATLLPRRGRRDASSLGPRPAHSRLAVPTREHQSGGPPIHAAPTRSWPTLARPPPTGHLADAPSEHQEPLTGGSPLDGAVPYQKVERVGHGFRSFTNDRLRLLLHCGVRWRTHRPARGARSLLTLGGVGLLLRLPAVAAGGDVGRARHGAVSRRCHGHPGRQHQGEGHSAHGCSFPPGRFGWLIGGRCTSGITPPQGDHDGGRSNATMACPRVVVP